jgi:hypothetical protein
MHKADAIKLGNAKKANWEVIKMFGAIIGIAAKFIGGGAASGAVGGILGKLGGGLLGGLFKGGAAKEIFDMVSNFRSNFLGGAAQQPPLGNFGRGDDFCSTPENNRSRIRERLLDRIDRLISRLEGLRGQDEGSEGACRCNSSSDGIDRIRELLRQLVGSSNDQSQVGFQFTRAQFTNLQV